MDWKNVAGMLPKGLELLGNAVGGPIGMAARGVGTLMAHALGVNDDPDSVAQAIKADPQSAAKLIELQTSAKVQLQQIASAQIVALSQEETKRQAAELADIHSARTRDMAITAAGKHNLRGDVMIAGVTIGLIACLVVLVRFDNGLPGEVVGIISTIAGIFGACLKDAFTFEFGSSRSSREKDVTLSEIAKMP